MLFMLRHELSLDSSVIIQYLVYMLSLSWVNTTPSRASCVYTSGDLSTISRERAGERAQPLDAHIHPQTPTQYIVNSCVLYVHTQTLTQLVIYNCSTTRRCTRSCVSGFCVFVVYFLDDPHGYTASLRRLLNEWLRTEGGIVRKRRATCTIPGQSTYR